MNDMDLTLFDVYIIFIKLMFI